ncbi:hypothetical protein ACHHYP_13581 [Achlya hypogyna]|uniref:Secreted protein n=1 Tax=Achlya hypogyna TaxID=1202772 RepID=A0A1V9YEX8_ACHHY|nr:hypothetical protein ACHHYP_13581 [Achlya hypogyna]
MLLRTTLALLLCVASLAHAQVGAPGPKKRVGRTARHDYYHAVSNDKNYDEDNKLRICADAFLDVTSQVVAGTKYTFHVNGCVVNSAENAGEDCDCGDKTLDTYEVVVFAQSWTHTYEVSSIAKVSAIKADL